MGAKKVITKMAIGVDLSCDKCTTKIKRILCGLPQVQDRIFNEEDNIVLIKVVCCTPEKIKKTILYKGGKTVKSVEILADPATPKPTDQPKEAPPPPAEKPKDLPPPPVEKPKSPPPPEPMKIKAAEPVSLPVPVPVPVPIPVTKPPPAPAPAPAPAPKPLEEDDSESDYTESDYETESELEPAPAAKPPPVMNPGGKPPQMMNPGGKPPQMMMPGGKPPQMMMPGGKPPQMMMPGGKPPQMMPGGQPPQMMMPGGQPPQMMMPGGKPPPPIVMPPTGAMAMKPPEAPNAPVPEPVIIINPSMYGSYCRECSEGRGGCGCWARSAYGAPQYYCESYGIPVYERWDGGPSRVYRGPYVNEEGGGGCFIM